jgi:hypothetical protein
MTSTFYSLLPLADLKSPSLAPAPEQKIDEKGGESEVKDRHATTHRPTLHYNIQIHLPATKDVEVFNSIFKSLREHLLD